MISLDQPLSTSSPGAERVFAHLQANILAAHPRRHLEVWFLRFEVSARLVEFLVAIRPFVKSAATQLQERERFRTTGAAAAPYVGVGLSANGYALLDTHPSRRPQDRSFADGAKAAAAALGDPDVADWEPAFRQDWHAVLLVGAATANGLSTITASARSLLAGVVVHVEAGHDLRDSHDRPVEHFGFVDGISNPVFLADDAPSVAADEWDPVFPVGRALTTDLGVPLAEDCFGSYLVFRKLEQNVRRFHTMVHELALTLRIDSTGLNLVRHERAAALLVGRHRDGTPLVESAIPLGARPPGNRFTFAADPEGRRCPVFAHVRTLNGRTNAATEEGLEERAHVIARRGQTYGERLDDPIDASVPISERPDRGVGLLFMCINADIVDQFEVQQAHWANDPDFPRIGAGVEPIIGRGPTTMVDIPTTWGGVTMKRSAIQETVRLLGAGYFFLPSLPFLASPHGA